MLLFISFIYKEILKGFYGSVSYGWEGFFVKMILFDIYEGFVRYVLFIRLFLFDRGRNGGLELLDIWIRL